MLQVNNICSARALGTALEWPEAKKKADLVRKWGIEVISQSCSESPGCESY